MSITPTKGRVAVSVNGERIADTREALTLKEAAYPPARYIPRKDVDMTQLQRTRTRRIVPTRAGNYTYYSIPAGRRSVNAVWSFEAVARRIGQSGILAFYPDRVDVIEIDSKG